MRFQTWTQRYLAAPPAERANLETEGVRLAEERRPVFKKTIVSDPRAALQMAVPMVVRQQLPPTVLAKIEGRVNGRGALRVYQGVGADNQSPAPTVRVAEMAAGKTYEARVYGRRLEDVKSLANASLHGVALDQEFAVSEDPFRPLEIGEIPDAAKPAVAVCPVSGKTALPPEDQGQAITEATPALEACGEIVYLCDGSHVMFIASNLSMRKAARAGRRHSRASCPPRPRLPSAMCACSSSR